ncbi:hypothetical protein E2C01_060510 [Portunus trituberculatus]|uniref:Uncharacterized protein n=1 Tax=Portunus trituberculatus TaxID=210409 RepID=A0A5B7H899_PORTR|nr:hypothetical protein [Portunus trituberculatus]
MDHHHSHHRHHFYHTPEPRQSRLATPDAPQTPPRHRGMRRGVPPSAEKSHGTVRAGGVRLATGGRLPAAPRNLVGILPQRHCRGWVSGPRGGRGGVGMVIMITRRGTNYKEPPHLTPARVTVVPGGRCGSPGKT